MSEVATSLRDERLLAVLLGFAPVGASVSLTQLYVVTFGLQVDSELGSVVTTRSVDWGGLVGLSFAAVDTLWIGLWAALHLGVILGTPYLAASWLRSYASLLWLLAPLIICLVVPVAISGFKLVGVLAHSHVDAMLSVGASMIFPTAGYFVARKGLARRAEANA